MSWLAGLTNIKHFFLIFVNLPSEYTTCISMVIERALQVTKFNRFWWSLHLPRWSREYWVQSNLKHLDDTMRSYIIKMIGIFVSYSFCLIAPAHAYIVDGTISTTTELKLPFIEPKSNGELLGNLMIQTIIVTHPFIEYIGMEVFLTIFQNAVAIAPQLVKMENDDAIELYESKKISKAELTYRVKEIAKKSCDADRTESHPIRKISLNFITNLKRISC